jgi:protein-disulfide isomerase
VRVLFALIAVLCLTGVGVSIELTRIHVMTHTDPEFHSICAVSEGVNCETVALSPYSVFAGLPNSVWGIIGYALTGLLALWGLTRLRLHSLWPAGALMALFLVTLVFSAFLAYVSFTRIDVVCLFCTASYVIGTALFLIGVVLLRRARTGLFTAFVADLKALVRRPVVLAVCAVLGVAPVVTTQLLIVPYWDTTGWGDLPDLPTGEDRDGYHFIGARDPLVTIVEFSDYECPHCRKAHKKMRLLAAEHPDEVRLVHRHLPLDRSCHPLMRRQLHQRACEFAKAAECAGEQGKFFAMNDALFSMQEEVKAADIDLGIVAVRLGLDRPRFDKCMTGMGAMKKVKRDLDEAIDRRLRGTPSFFLDGEKHAGLIPREALEQALAAARKKR